MHIQELPSSNSPNAIDSVQKRDKTYAVYSNILHENMVSHDLDHCVNTLLTEEYNVVVNAIKRRETILSVIALRGMTLSELHSDPCLTEAKVYKKMSLESNPNLEKMHWPIMLRLIEGNTINDVATMVIDQYQKICSELKEIQERATILMRKVDQLFLDHKHEELNDVWSMLVKDIENGQIAIGSL